MLVLRLSGGIDTKMMPKIYAAIEAAIVAGTPPQYVAANLIEQGWPSAMVNEALNAYLSAHGRLQHKTGFRDWLKKYFQPINSL